jgi:hypothetical protein
MIRWLTPLLQIFCYTIPPTGIAATLLWVLVMPKLRRVASGEKVVVSALLDSRYNSSTSSTESSEQKSSLSSSTPIGTLKTIKLGDAVPRSMEVEIHRLSETLQAVQTLW